MRKPNKLTKGNLLWWWTGVFVAIVAIVLNVNTMFYKMVPFFRGDLVGEALELGLFGALSFHTLILIGQGYLLVYLHREISRIKVG